MLPFLGTLIIDGLIDIHLRDPLILNELGQAIDNALSLLAQSEPCHTARSAETLTRREESLAVGQWILVLRKVEGARALLVYAVV